MFWRYGTDLNHSCSGPIKSVNPKPVQGIPLVIGYWDAHRRQSAGAESSIETSAICRGRIWRDASGYSDDYLLRVGVAGRRLFRTCHMVSTLFPPWLAKIHRRVQFDSSDRARSSCGSSCSYEVVANHPDWNAITHRFGFSFP